MALGMPARRGAGGAHEIPVDPAAAWHAGAARELEQALVSKDGEVAEKVSAVSAALKLQFNATIRSLTEAKEAAAKESNVAALELAVQHRAG